jgi:penicillin-binding protein 1C
MHILCLLVCLGLSEPCWALPSYTEVRQQYQPSDSWLLARDGQPLQQLRLNHSVRRLQWQSLEEMSPILLQALLYSEDQRFYQHSGVDWQAVAAASWRNLWDNKTRGASTITMQLAGLLAQSGPHPRRNWWQKIEQSKDALTLEQQWQKSQILEVYLNLVTFRGELQGVAAMSAALFNKAPAALDAREAAMAAVLLRAPNAKSQVVAERACRLLKSMQKAQFCADLEGYAALKLVAPYAIELVNDAPHLARALLRQPGQSVRSTVDKDLQQFAIAQLRANLLQLQYQQVHDGAVLVLDNATGEALAWVGSSAALSASPALDAVLTKRQAGSTLKPFLYASALAQRQLTAASILDDSPVRIATSAGDYVPQNYDKQFVGAVSLRKALASSLNVPAVRTLLQVTPDKFLSQLQRLHFVSLDQNADYYGYSLALGAADVRLLELSNAYRTLANLGRYSPVQTRWQAQAKVVMQPVLEPAAAYIISDILADNNARLHTFGMDSLLHTPYWSAVKTGTSKDMRDNWCVGFSHRYTVGVWVGNADGAPMHDVSGVTGAAPVWRAVMDYLQQHADGRPVQTLPVTRPQDVINQPIRFEPAIEPARQELFIAGTQQSVIYGKTKQVDGLLRIAYPSPGAVIALDPEIPQQQQRIVFAATQPTPENWRWLLDQQVINPQQAWLPMLGRHQLSLQNAQKQTVDSLQFEVRGAYLKQSKIK